MNRVEDTCFLRYIACMEKITRPVIKVAPPGPKAQVLIDRDHAVTSPSYIKEYPLVVESGQGSFVIDVDGNSYLDFMAGIAVTSTGHAHPKVVKAIQDAAAKLKGMLIFCL